MSWRAVKPIWRYGDFSIFQDGDRRHLGFINFHDFNCRNAQEIHPALSCQISWWSVKLSRRYADFSIVSIWRLSAILDLWCACLDHPRRAFGDLYHCAKFGWNRCSTFHNMHVFWFHEFGLKMYIHAPTRAPIANTPNGTQLGVSPYHSPKLHPGPFSNVDVRPRTDTHTDTQTRVTTTHFASSTTHAKCNEW